VKCGTEMKFTLLLNSVKEFDTFLCHGGCIEALCRVLFTSLCDEMLHLLLDAESSPSGIILVVVSQHPVVLGIRIFSFGYHPPCKNIKI
jgi:hypothetical protein